MLEFEKNILSDKKKHDNLCSSALESVFASDNILVCIVEVLEDDFIYIRPNKNMADVVNLSSEQLTGKKGKDVHGEHDYSILLDLFRNAIESNSSVSSELKFENDPANRCFYASVAPITNEGHPDLITMTGFEISEYKQTKQDLADSKDRYIRMFEDSSLGIFQSFIDGGFNNVNQALADIFGYSNPRDMINSVLDITNQLYVTPSCRLEAIHSFVENPDGNYIAETEFFRKDGSIFNGRINVRKVFFENQYFLEGFIEDISTRVRTEEENRKMNNELEEKVLARTSQLKQAFDELTNEITVRRNAEKDLRQANNAKDKLMSIIAHDMTNPLQSLLLSSEILYTNYMKFDETQLINKYRQINNSTKNLSILYENLLQWANSQRGKISFNPSKFDFHRMVNECADIFSDQFISKNINLKINVADQFKLVGDKNMIKTICRNLISNAVKFTNPGGLVEIQAFKFEDINGFSIKDNGIGISAMKLEKLFDKNENVSTYGTNSEKGTGLGLLICKDFVERHHGVIRADSTYGKGAEFSVRLPIR
jgi:PAS domain S-box-containing protein